MKLFTFQSDYRFCIVLIALTFLNLSHPTNSEAKDPVLIVEKNYGGLHFNKIRVTQDYFILKFNSSGNRVSVFDITVENLTPVRVEGYMLGLGVVTQEKFFVYGFILCEHISPSLVRINR